MKKIKIKYNTRIAMYEIRIVWFGVFYKTVDIFPNYMEAMQGKQTWTEIKEGM